jgi:four helix bundle protein
MPAARSFTDLLFWQRARAWSREIFQHTQNSRFARDERLVRQINDSSESVMANMAEGFGRGTQEEFITFLGYAIGSLDETQSHLIAATLPRTAMPPSSAKARPSASSLSPSSAR